MFCWSQVTAPVEWVDDKSSRILALKTVGWNGHEKQQWRVMMLVDVDGYNLQQN